MSLQVRNQTSGILERVAGFNDTDSILSPSSQNPISNRAVYAALAQKIDKTVTDLINYYDKTQVYNKPEVRALIGAINTLTIEVVSQLPTQDISTTTIYFVGPAAGTNNYDEYVYVGGNWVQIGDTTIDLSNYVTSANLTTVLQDYYTKSQADALFNDYYDKDAVDDLLDLKQDTLTFDNTPIAGSQNPVTSAGIKTALDNILISGNGGSIIKVHHTAEAAAAGNTVTASKGDYSVSSTFDVSGDAIIIGFGEIGNITITATNGSESGSTIINIPNFSVYTAIVSYGLDYKSWLLAGGIDPSYYDSLDEVLADEEVVRRLMTIHASVDYLATLDRTDDEMALTLFNNDICAKWINLRDYALDTLYANTYAKTIMDEADKYGYGEWALMPQVPTMTSNTAPYGEAITSGAYSGQPAYYAFDGSTSNAWEPATSAIGTWIGYQFTTPIVVKKIFAKVYAGTTGTITWQTQGYDGSDWVNIGEPFTVSYDASATVNEININLNNDIPYLKLRIIKITQSPTFYSFVAVLQFYAWGPKGNVPIMTNNTAPYGTAIRSGVYNSQEAWRAFDGNETTCWQGANVTPNSWIGYTFVNPVNIKAFKIGAYTNQRIITFQIEASNDNSTWTPITGVYTMGSSGVTWNSIISFNNTQYYTGYRVHVLTTVNNYEPLVYTLQFYGREMKVSIPAMTSNMAPYGEAFASSVSSTSYPAWHAFNKDTISSLPNWASSSSDTSAYLAYGFPYSVSIRKIVHQLRSNENGATWKIQYSDDKQTWYDTTEDSTYTAITGQIVNININDNGSHKYWRIQGISKTGSGTTYFYATELYLFGFDYSERDWDTEHPMTYLYDHGVEPTDVITSVANASGNAFIKEPSRLTINKTSTSAWNAMYPTNQIDVTDYTLARAVSTDGTGINGVASLATCSNLSTGATDSYKVMAANLAPYNQYNDMTSVNTSRWITIGFSTNVTGNIAISEWWLE